jgi:cytochrome c-type biogenesis protein
MIALAPAGAALTAAAAVGGVAASTGETVVNGSLLIAAPLAFAAGVLSFLSPCVLPLVPGYLSFITGLTGAELAGEAAAPAPAAQASAVAGGSSGGTAVATASTASTKSRVVLGTLLFVAGFTAVFVSYGALFGSLGSTLLQYADVISRILGVVVIGLGLAFMGVIPGLQREYRFHMSPKYGVWGAPLLGVLFGLGWTPCIGPTLAAVQSLAFAEASAVRGALLSFFYCLGLGLPFLIVGLAFRRALGALGWVKRHYLLVMRIGGGMLVLIGLLLVTGMWGEITIWMRTWVSGFSPAL